MDFPFNRLPLDLQGYLFKFRPDLLPIAYRVSKSFQHRIRHYYLAAIGSYPISKKEIKKYLLRRSIPISYLQCLRKPGRYPFRVLISWFTSTEAYSVEYRLSPYDINDNILELSIIKRTLNPPLLNSNLTQWGELNIFNLYEIYQSRQSCTKINPNYNRDHLINSIKNRLNNSLIFNRECDLIIIYLNLFVFFRVAGYPTPRLSLDPSEEKDFIYSYYELNLIGPSDRFLQNINISRFDRVKLILNVFTKHINLYLNYLSNLI